MTDKRFNAEKKDLYRDFSDEKCRNCESPNIHREGSGSDPLRAMYRCEDCGVRRVLTLEDSDGRYGPQEDTDWDSVERADNLWDRMPMTVLSEVEDISMGKLESWRQNGWISTERNWQGISFKIWKMATQLDKEEIADRMDMDVRAVEYYV